MASAAATEASSASEPPLPLRSLGAFAFGTVVAPSDEAATATRSKASSVFSARRARAASGDAGSAKTSAVAADANDPGPSPSATPADE